jgi:Co/Zn/Cd efflux system component
MKPVAAPHDIPNGQQEIANAAVPVPSAHSLVPTPYSPSPDRYTDVTRVLVRVLVLNLGVAFAKIAFGYATGAISMLSDGFHSLTDGASNIVGLIGVRLARRPPDDDHPYGHRKYETVAAAAVILFLSLVVIEVLRNARGPAPVLAGRFSIR